MRLKYRNWYKACYNDILSLFSPNSNHILYWKSICAQLELESHNFHDSQINPWSRKNLIALGVFLFSKTKIEVIVKTNHKISEHNFVFWPSQAKHIELHYPVYNAMVEKGKLPLFVFMENLDFYNCKELLGKLDFVNVKVSQKAGVKWNFVTFSILVLFKALSLKTYRNSSGKKIKYFDVVLTTLKYLTFFESYKEFIDSHIGNSQIRGIMVGYDFSTPARSVSLNVAPYGIKTFSIEVGILNFPMTRYSDVDYYMMYGKKSVDFFARNASPKTKTFAVGSTKIDDYKSKKVPKDLEEYFSAKKEGYEHAVLIAFTGPGVSTSLEGHKQNVLAIRKLVEELKETFFVFKLNTKDDSAFYDEIGSFNNVLIVDRENYFIRYDILYWIQITDFMITAISTSCIQALKNGRPVISLDMNGELEENYLLKENAILYANSYLNLLKYVNLLSLSWDDAKRQMEIREFNEQYFCENENNNSANVIANKLEELLF